MRRLPFAAAACLAAVAMGAAAGDALRPGGEPAERPRAVGAGLAPSDAAAPEAPSLAADATPELPIDVDVRGFILPGSRVDGAAFAGEELILAVRTSSGDPAQHPAVIRLHRDRGEGGTETAWEAAVLGASPVTVATSGGPVLATWSQDAHPGRDLALLLWTPAEDGSEPRLILAAPPEGEPAFAPTGAPLVAAHPDGWLVCSDDARGAPRCLHVTRGGEVTWRTIRALRSYSPWALLPAPGGGFWLFATTCALDRCGQTRVVLQALDPSGETRGALRGIGRFQVERTLGVAAVANGALLTGRRVGARDATALALTHRGSSEISGRWNRNLGALAVDGGALAVELAPLRMDDGRPVAPLRPRRWLRAEGRLEPERWPRALTVRLPVSLDQQVTSLAGLVLAWDPPRDGLIRGVALRPTPGTAEAVPAR